MTGRTVATAHWRALDREGEDNCRLAQVDQGWLLVGHARFRDADGFAALDYVVRCDEGWRTLSADIAGTHGDRRIKLAVTTGPEGWRVNEEVQPQISGAQDLDLSFTPATNLMPMRRLMDGPVAAVHTRAAWLLYPDCEVKPLDQTYHRVGKSGHVRYFAKQTGTTMQLDVDPSGFVTRYPGLWEGEVTHATP